MKLVDRVEMQKGLALLPRAAAEILGGISQLQKFP